MQDGSKDWRRRAGGLRLRAAAGLMDADARLEALTKGPARRKKRRQRKLDQGNDALSKRGRSGYHV